MKNQQGFIGLPILLAIVLGVAVLGGGAYFVIQKSKNPQGINVGTEIVYQCPDGKIYFGGIDSDCKDRSAQSTSTQSLQSEQIADTLVLKTQVLPTPSAGFQSLGLGQTILSDEDKFSGYMRDVKGIYVMSLNGRGREVIGADAETFEVNTAWPIYARDSTHVYVYGEVVPSADPNIFVAMCGHSMQMEAFCAYGKDAKHVYAYTQIVPDADPTTFVSLVSNNDTNKNSAGKSWISSAIDASAYYSGYVPSQYGDLSSKLSGNRISKFSDGSPLHFSDTSKVVAINLNTASWGGYYEGVKIGSKSYYGGVYLVDGTVVYTLYSACDVDSSGKEINCTGVLSRVDKVGDRPREVQTR